MYWLYWFVTSSTDSPYTVCERPKKETYSLVECAGKSGMWYASWVSDEDGEPQEDVMRVTPVKNGCAIVQRKSDPDWPHRSEKICSPLSSALRCVFSRTRHICRFK